MSKVRALYVAVFLSLPHAVTAGAQTPPAPPAQLERAAVELAAVEYVKKTLLPQELGSHIGAGAVVLDSHIGQRSDYLKKGRSSRSAGQAQQLASVMGAPLVDGDSVLGCRDEHDTRTCRLRDNGPALVRLGSPVVRQDSAFTSVTLLRGISIERDPVNIVVWHLVLVRRDGRWQVSRQALSMRS